MKYNHWSIQPAENINPAISRLPKGELYQMYAAPKDSANVSQVPNRLIVHVTQDGESLGFVNPCTPQYELVQHDPAFRPMIDALTVSGVKDFKFSLTHNIKEANLWLFVDGAGYDGVSLGIEIQNSFCGHKTLTYGINLDKYNRWIELVGYREVCSNGMVMRVPLDKAEFVKPELRQKIETIASKRFSFRHTANVMDRVEEVKYFTEAVALLRAPVEAMIKAGQAFKLDGAKLSKLIELHVGKRYQSKVLDQMANEQNDLWGLYNAITYVASHDVEITDTSRSTLLDKAATMLVAELRA